MATDNPFRNMTAEEMARGYRDGLRQATPEELASFNQFHVQTAIGGAESLISPTLLVTIESLGAGFLGL